MGGEDDMRAWASAALQAEPDKGEIEFEQRVDGKLLAGNRRGLNLSVELADLRNDVAALRQSSNRLDQSNNQLEARVNASNSKLQR